MADFKTPTNCSLLTVWNGDSNLIDHWVASHQILPFFATIYGWDVRLVIIGVYFAETVENTVWCIERSFHEDISNAIISDPVQGLLGALLGYLYRRKVGTIRDEDTFVSSQQNVMITLIDMIAIVAPFTILYTNNRKLDYLLILLFSIAFLFVHRNFSGVDCAKRLAIALPYVTVTSLAIFAHPFELNTFYVGVLCALLYSLFLLLLSNEIKYSTI